MDAAARLFAASKETEQVRQIGFKGSLHSSEDKTPGLSTKLLLFWPKSAAGAQLLQPTNQLHEITFILLYRLPFIHLHLRSLPGSLSLYQFPVFHRANPLMIHKLLRLSWQRRQMPTGFNHSSANEISMANAHGSSSLFFCAIPAGARRGGTLFRISGSAAR